MELDLEYFRYAERETRLLALGHSIFVVFLAFGVGLTLAIGVGFGYELLTGGTPTEGLSTEAIALASAFQFLGFVAVALGYTRMLGKDLLPVDTPSLKEVLAVIVGFGVLFGASLALSLVIQALGLQTAENSVITTGTQDPVFFLYMIPVALFLVGPGEELVFRGVVQGLFREAYGVIPAVLVTSLIFGIAHFLALTGSGKVTYILIAATLGIVLGAVYELTDNLIVPIAIHSFWNTMLFSINYVAAVYDIPQPILFLIP